MPIDETRAFVPLQIAVLTISDTRETTTDRSGDTLEKLLVAAGHRLAWRKLVRDEEAEIVAAIREAAADSGVDVLISTGGTGITARDVTPEAFEQVADKTLPGFGELFRQQGFDKIGTSAIQSRAMAGVVAKTVVFVLPGSPGACRDGWTLIAEMLDARHRPCNLVEMLPRL